MSKNRVSTLEGFIDDGIQSSGRSTRLADNAIQIIFNNDICVVEDHNGDDNDLFDSIINRLNYEHFVDKFPQYWNIDKHKLTIERIIE